MRYIVFDPAKSTANAGIGAVTILYTFIAFRYHAAFTVQRTLQRRWSARLLDINGKCDN